MQDENEGLEELPGTVTSGVDLAHAIMMLVVMSDFDRSGGIPISAAVTTQLTCEHEAAQAVIVYILVSTKGTRKHEQQIAKLYGGGREEMIMTVTTSFINRACQYNYIYSLLLSHTRGYKYHIRCEGMCSLVWTMLYCQVYHFSQGA